MASSEVCGMHKASVLVLILLGVMVNADKSAFQCLTEDLQDDYSGSDDSVASDSSTFAGLKAASISFTACATSISGVSEVLFPGVAFALNTTLAAQHSTWNETVQCAATCASYDHMQRSTAGHVVQFMMYNGSCACFNQTDVIEVAEIVNGFNGTTCSYGAVFHLHTVCTLLNATEGCGTGCQPVDGCCIPSTTPDPNELPAYYRTMVQWVAIVVIVLALLEAVVYGCLRRRAAVRNAQPRRSRDTLMRDKRNARELTERLISSLPASPTAAQQPSIAEDSCSICLDPLDAHPSLTLPCGHHIHATCVKDFVTHELMRANSASCPMCRAPLITEDEARNGSDESEDDHEARAVRVAIQPANMQL